MPEFIRVKDKSTRHEYTINALSYDEKAHTHLKDKDAVHTDGTPLPPKHYVLPKSDAASTYEGQTVGELKDEIQRRNDLRDEPIVVGGPGNKPDLIEALVADDNENKENS